MGKYSKYSKKYNPDWEKLSWFSGNYNYYSNIILLLITMILLGRLQRASDLHSDRGEAYCKLCRTALRDHKTIQGMHIKSNDEKIRDLKLAFYIASHSSIRTIDHLGELLKDMNGPTSSFNTLLVF